MLELDIEGKATEDTSEHEVQLRMSQARKAPDQISTHSPIHTLGSRGRDMRTDILDAQTRPSALTKGNKVAVKIRTACGLRIL